MPRTGLAHTISPARPGEASFEALLTLVEHGRESIGARLLVDGAILLRGFEVETTERFAALVAALSGGSSLAGYAGGASPRSRLGSGKQPVYNSTEYPAHIALPLHNELSYTDHYPHRIYFFCLVAPEDGGETTLGDSRRILAAMPPRIRAQFETRGLRYIRILSRDAGSAYSWQHAFETKDPAAVEATCAAIGATPVWLADGTLRVSQNRPATATHPLTGDNVWFNQADGFHPSVLDPASYSEMLGLYGGEDRFRLNVTYGDGGQIEVADLEIVRAVLRSETVPHRWQEGDVLMLDNLLTAHGRAPFAGPRRIAVAMT
jgi:alpha-ketoglutarate-dependent taurine dioxygenase